MAKHIYYVLFDFADYTCERVYVYADNKRECRQIMRNQYGTDVVIRGIDIEE